MDLFLKKSEKNWKNKNSFLHLHSFRKDMIHCPFKRPVRLGVRTQDFHSCNTGSIPVRATKKSGCF